MTKKKQKHSLNSGATDIDSFQTIIDSLQTQQRSHDNFSILLDYLDPNCTHGCFRTHLVFNKLICDLTGSTYFPDITTLTTELFALFETRTEIAIRTARDTLIDLNSEDIVLIALAEHLKVAALLYHAHSLMITPLPSDIGIGQQLSIPDVLRKHLFNRSLMLCDWILGGQMELLKRLLIKEDALLLSCRVLQQKKGGDKESFRVLEDSLRKIERHINNQRNAFISIRTFLADINVVTKGGAFHKFVERDPNRSLEVSKTGRAAQKGLSPKAATFQRSYLVDAWDRYGKSRRVRK